MSLRTSSIDRARKSLSASDEKLIRESLLAANPNADHNTLLPDDGRQHLKFSNEYDSSGSITPASEAPSALPKAINGDIAQRHTRQSSLRSVSSDVSVESKPSKPPKLPKPESSKKIRNKYRYINLSSAPTESILDSTTSRHSNFIGFYTLFWTLTAIAVARRLLYNYLDTKQVFGTNIVELLMTDLIPVALTDLAMYLSTYFGFFLQYAIKKKYLTWEGSGWIIQNLYQTLFLFFFLWVSVKWKYPWIARVFLLLHSLVFIMKQHSYSFYNGHFWNITKELNTAQEKLAKDREKLSEDEVLSLNAAIAFCKDEIALQAPTVRFPENITLKNHFWYSMFPTLVYQIEYPRTNKIRWYYVGEKLTATFGVFFLMIFLAQEYLYPIAMRAIALQNHSFLEKCQVFPLIFLDLVPPFAMMYLLVFYIIWDAILNAIAELTFFADRNFYGEWWNCVTWDEFAKLWNVPVHRFLLRHVYHSSIASMHLSKGQATLFTFLLSSAIHELVMLVIFGRLRGYLLLLQMCQLPLAALSRSKCMKDRLVLGNIIFWMGIITGPSIMCSLYLTF